MVALLATGAPQEPELAPGVLHTLRSAERVALARLEAVPACRGLFDSLGADGAATVRRLEYRPVTRAELPYCERGWALAYPGDPVVAVCPWKVAELPLHQVAAGVVHEALHVAGLPESPPVTGAPTSREITAAVVMGCRLETAAPLD